MACRGEVRSNSDIEDCSLWNYNCGVWVSCIIVGIHWSAQAIWAVLIIAIGGSHLLELSLTIQPCLSSCSEQSQSSLSRDWHQNSVFGLSDSAVSDSLLASVSPVSLLQLLILGLLQQAPERIHQEDKESIQTGQEYQLPSALPQQLRGQVRCEVSPELTQHRSALRAGEPGRGCIVQLARGGVVGLPLAWQEFSVQCAADPGWKTAALHCCLKVQVKQMDSRTFSCICFK